MNVVDILGHWQLLLTIGSVKGSNEGGFRFGVNEGIKGAVAGVKACG